MHMIGERGLSKFLKHAEDNTPPVHGNKGKTPANVKQFQQEVIPILEKIFEDHILPNGGPRPTLFVRDVVTDQVGIRDGNGVQELDPGMTKNRLFAQYAWNNGWLVKFDALKKTITRYRAPMRNGSANTLVRVLGRNLMMAIITKALLHNSIQSTTSTK